MTLLSQLFPPSRIFDSPCYPPPDEYLLGSQLASVKKISDFLREGGNAGVLTTLIESHARPVDKRTYHKLVDLALLDQDGKVDQIRAYFKSLYPSVTWPESTTSEP